MKALHHSDSPGRAVIPKLLEGDNLETQDDLSHPWRWPCLSGLCLERGGNIRKEYKFLSLTLHILLLLKAPKVGCSSASQKLIQPWECLPLHPSAL